MILVGLSGKQRVGKDTIAAYLQLKYDFIRLANADRLKEIASLVGWDGKKNSNGRRLLQKLGVVVREYSKNFWISRVSLKIQNLQDMNPTVAIVVTDVRFTNEADEIKRLGGTIVRVTRSTGIEDAHVSETELDNYPVDYVIKNDSGYDRLYLEVDTLLPKISDLVVK